jgi:hypothetical protein
MEKRLSIAAVETAHFHTAEVVVEAAGIAHTPAEVVVAAVGAAHTPAEVGVAAVGTAHKPAEVVVAAVGTAHKLAAVVVADRNRQEQAGHRIHTDCPAERQIQQAHLDQQELEIS